MTYEVVMPYHLHMPSYFLGTFTEYPNLFVFRTTRQTCYSEIFQKSIICVLLQKSLSLMQRIHPPVLLSLLQF